MRRTGVFRILTDNYFHPERQSFLYGTMFVLFGVFILLFPQILVLIVAGFFILIGLILLATTWGFRQSHLHYYSGKDVFHFFD